MPQVARITFRDRERLKRLRARWVAKFQTRTREEQAMLFAALRQARQQQPSPADSRDLQVQRWLASYPLRTDVTYMDSAGARDETSEQRQARLFKDVLYELSLLIDEFGYEAVYFGVGCEAFPDAVDPWSGDGQY